MILTKYDFVFVQYLPIHHNLHTPYIYALVKKINKSKPIKSANKARNKNTGHLQT